jgi:hypothetical protein
MFDFNTFKQKSPKQRFLFILGLVMFGMYVVLGVAFIAWKDIPFDFKPIYRILFGVLLIVYAGIRFFRLINQKDN